MGTSPEDGHFMGIALALGRRGMGNTWPNPSVGCLLVRDGRVVGRGWTGPGGTPHAEVVALEHAGSNARQTTAYVTLEPCAHLGRTGACTDALIKGGVVRVVSAVEDPDPRVSGRGHLALKSAGIEVDIGCRSEGARQDHRGFFSRVTSGRPAITLKMAMTYDGKVAAAEGVETPITGNACRAMCHVLRSIHDAVMIGNGTASVDDPRLNVRLAGIDHQPVRIVMDTSLSLNPESNLARSARDHPVWLCHGPAAPPDRAEILSRCGAQLIECRASPRGGIDVGDALARIGSRGINSIFCEGGPRLAASLLADNRVNELIGFTAGRILGHDGVAAIGRLDEQIPQFRLQSVERCGNDSICHWIRD